MLMRGGLYVSQRNITDSIEAYLKSVLKGKSQVEIRRSDIAEHFDCVPSQINYVINTRFTQEHGYVVESKRGGGGYIRILKIQLVDEVDAINEMIRMVGNHITSRNAINIIETLVNHQIITQREGQLILAVIDRDFLQAITEQEQEVRAVVLSQFLNQLRYTYRK